MQVIVKNGKSVVKLAKREEELLRNAAVLLDSLSRHGGFDIAANCRDAIRDIFADLSKQGTPLLDKADA